MTRHRDPLRGRSVALREVVADPLGELDGPVGVGPGQDEQELLAAPAGGDVDVADRALEQLRELAEHGVPDAVPVRVVHRA